MQEDVSIIYSKYSDTILAQNHKLIKMFERMEICKYKLIRQLLFIYHLKEQKGFSNLNFELNIILQL